MSVTVFDRLSQRLTEASVPFDVQRHEPVFTSEEAARVRGTPLASGAKALICKADDQFVMFVMPADRRLDSKLVRKNCKVRSLRFATAEEVKELTGLVPGSIPPFGSLFNLPTWCDSQLSAQPRINFNAGDHSISVSITYADYVSVEQPQLADFASLV
jgi:Ala-tRNA(Pro) deacylase